MSFLWGAATSSHQIEGGNHANDWWQWEAQGHIDHAERSGLATDHFHRWREDLDCAQSLGLNSYRFSLEWSRIEPEPSRFDEKALDWYEELILGCEARGLQPMVTLHHFTLPQWLAEQGGISAAQMPDRFATYVEKVARRLGPRVRLWCTINEPMVLVAGSYLAKFMPPAIFSPRRASQACANLLRCHWLAYHLLHQLDSSWVKTGPWRDQPLQVGFAHNMIDFHPFRAWHPLERWLAYQCHRFYNQSWLDAVCGRPQHFGIPGIIPKAPPVPEIVGRTHTDFIGINYYTQGFLHVTTRRYAQGFAAGIPLQLAFAKPDDPVTDLDWSMKPEGLQRVLQVAGRYKKPIMITENGLADHRDLYRARFIHEHLQVLASAIAQGADIRGYYHWSLLDNFEWIKGFKPRFGLYEVDFGNFSRHRRPSAHDFQQIIERHHRQAPSTEILNELIRK